MKAARDAQSGGRTLIVLAAAFFVVLHLAWQAWQVAAAPYPARYDYDEGVYAATAAATAAGGRLYTGVFLSQPPLLIGVLAHTFGTFGRSLYSARGVIIAFSSLWLVSLGLIAARAGGLRTAVWAIGIAASAPAFVAASHTVQMEGPAEALAALAVALGLAAAAHAQTGAPRTLGVLWASAGFAAGLAVMTKFTALTCLVPLLAALTLTGTNAPARALAARAALAAGAAIIGAAVVLIWTDSLSVEAWRQTVAFHGAVARVTPIDFGRTFGLLGAFAAANWFVICLGLAGLVVTLSGQRPSVSDPDPARAHDSAAVSRLAIIAWLAANFAALLVWRPLWPHHFAILFTPLALLGAVTVESLWRGATRTTIENAASRRRPILRSLTGALAAVWLVVALPTVIAAARPDVSDALRAAAAETTRVVPSTAQVIADDPLVAFLADRNAPDALCDTSEMRVRAGWLTVVMLRAALGDPRVRGIVLWRGTFRRLAPAFVDDAVERFPRRWTLAGDREILAR